MMQTADIITFFLFISQFSLKIFEVRDASMHDSYHTIVQAISHLHSHSTFKPHFTLPTNSSTARILSLVSTKLVCVANCADTNIYI